VANFASICSHVAKAASEANDRVIQPNAHTLYTEPQTPKAALNAPDAALWKLAMDNEIHLLQDVMGCWEVMNISDLPSNANLIGCKWVYKVKIRENVYDKHRARIVALGYQQRQGVDYFQSFSPTASQISVRLVMALTNIPGFRSIDMDTTCAFISAPLPHTQQVYMTAVPGNPLKPGQCLRLRKTIYGLTQASRSSLNLDNILDHGMFDTMTEVPVDQRVYPSCPHPIASMILKMYVDNNLVRTNCDELVEDFETKVREHGRIYLNREGDGSWFLGVRYSFDKVSGAVSADQEAYIDTLLDNYGLNDCNPFQLPMRPDVDLVNIPLPPSPDPDNVRAYAMLIGELMYVAVNTVPTIAYAVSCLARYMTKATPQHYEYARQVLRYLKGVKHRKLTWCAGKVRYPLKRGELSSYADSSWADDKPSRKST
jgi:hypothetical protein